MTRHRILLLAFYFPPANAAGSARTRYLSEALAHAGWSVSVVTPFPRLWRKADEIGKTDDWMRETGIHRLGTGMRQSWRLPTIIRNEGRTWKQYLLWLASRASARLGLDCYAGWAREIDDACKHLRAGDIDLILASGSPFVAFAAAQRLARRLKTPYVLDYRDLWTSNPHGSRKWDWRYIKQEQRLLNGAAAVTCVSGKTAQILRERCQRPEKVHVLSNGYSPKHLQAIPKHSFDHFAIVYAGQLYPPKRVLDPIYRVLRELDLRDSNANWRFHYYGPNSRAVLASATSASVAHRVVDHGRVSRTEALSALHGAGAALVITTVLTPASMADAGIVPGKVFEAIGLAVPILAITPPESDLEAILNQSGYGKAFRPENVIGMLKYLQGLANGLKVSPRRPETYSWSNLGKQADTLLREACQRRDPSWPA